MDQPTFDPFGAPGAVALLIDAGQGLEGDLAIDPQVIVLTAKPQERGTHRATHVEHKEAGVRIAAKLQRESRQ
jgi:hypothetical protein